MATENFFVSAEDGWVAITDSPPSCIKIRSNTSNSAFFIATGSTTPDADVTGYKVQSGEFCVDVESSENYYIRVLGSPPQKTRFDVFTVASL